MVINGVTNKRGGLGADRRRKSQKSGYVVAKKLCVQYGSQCMSVEERGA